MATFHFAKLFWSRTSQHSAGQSVGGYVAYIVRADGEQSLREDLRHVETGNLPAWAGDNATHFFTDATTYERANARIAEGWGLSLPRALDITCQLALTRDFVAHQCGARLPYVWAVHEAPAADGGMNPHVHLVVSTRMQDGIARPPTQFFRRYNARLPALGGCRKDTRLGSSTKGVLRPQRVLWADLTNWYLEQAGSAERVTPEKLSAQGIIRNPEKTWGPYASVQDRTQALQYRQARQYTKAQEMEAAAAYWDDRKAALGIRHTMDHQEVVQRIQASSRLDGHGKKDLQTLQRELVAIHLDVMKEAYLVRKETEWRARHAKKDGAAGDQTHRGHVRPVGSRA